MARVFLLLSLNDLSCYLMDFNKLQLGVRDFIGFAGIIVTIMVNYYDLRSEIREIATDAKAQTALYDLKIKSLEDKLNNLQTAYDRHLYENLDRNVNQTSRTRSR